MVQKMKKSKGFTLIEMLVVIAIIAVLVSIVVPVVGNSTTKARAAADAANLRTAAASASIAYMEDGTVSASDLPSNGAITAKTSGAGSFAIYSKNNEIVAVFGTSTVADFAKVAESGGTLGTSFVAEGATKLYPAA